MEDAGNGVVRLTESASEDNARAQFNLVQKADGIFNFESVHNPGCFLEDAGGCVLRLAKATPGDESWAQFKLIKKTHDIYKVESVRSPGCFLDDGGHGNLQLTGPWVGDTAGEGAQFKFSLRYTLLETVYEDSSFSLQTDLCKSMLQQERGKRISLKDAIDHRWFNCITDVADPLSQELIERLRRRSHLSTLKVALLNMVASRLQGEHLGYYQSLWNRFDADKKGVLEQTDFIKVLSSPEINIHESDALNLHSMADADGNGNVDFNELTGIMFNPSALTQEQLEQHLRCIFHSIASRSQGQGVSEEAQITLKEFESVFSKGNPKPLIKELFSEIDTDKDGSITSKELANFLRDM